MFKGGPRIGMVGVRVLLRDGGGVLPVLWVRLGEWVQVLGCVCTGVLRFGAAGSSKEQEGGMGLQNF